MESKVTEFLQILLTSVNSPQLTIVFNRYSHFDRKSQKPVLYSQKTLQRDRDRPPG